MSWKHSNLMAVAAVLSCGLGPAASVAQAQIGSVARPFPDTSSKILVFTDQLPDQPTAAQWQFIASNYVGSQKELLSWTQQVRNLNPQFLMLHYQLALGNGPAAFVDGNQWVNDFATVSANPSWFLQDGSGNDLMEPDWDWSIMNIVFSCGQPVSGYPDYWISAAIQRLHDNQNDGVFADSYTEDVLFGQETPPFSWFTDVNACLANWIPNLNQYGAYCASALHAQPEKFYYLPNLGNLITGWDTTNYAVGDGGMIEGFAIPRSYENYATSDWQLEMGRVLGLASRGKIVICQSYIDPSDQDGRWFVAGSHLLTKGASSYLNMIQNGSLEWYPEYGVDLGAYLAAPVADLSSYWNPSWNVYQRNFAKGMVLVNPGTSPVTITLGANYQLLAATGGGPVGTDGSTSGSLSSTVVNSVTIPANSARILLQ